MCFRITADWINRPTKQPRSNWSLELGYDNLRSETAYPYRTFGSGPDFSLHIVLRVLNKDIDYLCGAGNTGFKIMFSQPTESLQKLRRYFHISLGRTAYFEIDPKLIVASEHVQKYKPHRRGCYLASERSLRFFKHYTQRNCEMECLTNYTLAQCGCIKFSMPSEMHKL